MRPPQYNGDLEAWILNVDTYLQNIQNGIERDARGLNVPFVRPDHSARATRGGLVMFDNVSGQLVVSSGGSFHALTTTPIVL